MQKVVPAFRITDYKKSKAFYVEGMGFQIDWEHRFEPDFPVFVQITKDEMTIYLTEHTGDCSKCTIWPTTVFSTMIVCLIIFLFVSILFQCSAKLFQSLGSLLVKAAIWFASLSR